ncbi:uncharacterized protein LOC126372680 [Pectinophora gossypiella]|uniref:uncharacterized protein LOC126372680 n=1 Tax=Pectinophora gossypiella TaxID=13191 RepID=UPI00214F259D|nr:uncharacterized protein LOC126372680 [Pectinophora gossypiella]
MFRAAVLLACLALCQSHAVLPVVPAVHTAPLVVAPLHHGYAGHDLYGHGLLGHGLVAKPLGHHLWKRSPHYVAPLAHAAHGYAVAPVAVAPVAHVAPVAVSHQSRVDVHSSPAVVAAPVLPVIKPVVAPVLAAPLLHKPLVAGPYYGLGGHYAGHYGGLGHGHYYK